MNWLKKFILKAFGILQDSRFESFVKIIKEVATRVVENLLDADLDGDGKRKHAFSEIKQYCIDQAIENKDAWINLVIELVYSSIRAKEDK